jgi:acyl carrier protein
MGLDSVEIVMEAERLFNIELPDEKVSDIFTFGAFVDLVFEPSIGLNRKTEYAEVESTLRKMVCDHLNVRPEQVKYESRFIEDLGMS